MFPGSLLLCSAPPAMVEGHGSSIRIELPSQSTAHGPWPQLIDGDPTYLFSISSPQGWLDLAQYLTNKQNTIDQHPVRRSFDLEVAEESICTE